MKKFRQILRRLMVILIVFTVLVNTLYMEVRAEANDIINVYISMAAGKQMADLDVSQLSDRDLQFLGVYLSNFFVPFGTELGATTDEVTQKNKENMVKALQKNMYFSESLAKSLVETVLGLSRSSATELKLYVSEEYQKDLVAVDNADASIPLNYYTALSAVFGGLPRLAGKYGNTSDVISKIARKEYKYGYFGYEKGGKAIPVFDFVINMGELTPSVSAFIKCLESTDITRGYGFNFFDFSDSNKEDFEDKYSQCLGEDGPEDDKIDKAYQMSMYGSRLRVDCFGNIILMGGNHQYVAIPGCMNPYTWVEVDSDGNTVGEGKGGTAYNMINVPSMSLGLDDGNGGNSLITAITSADASGEDTGLGEEFLDSETSIKIFDGVSLSALLAQHGNEDSNELCSRVALIIRYAISDNADTGVYADNIGYNTNSLTVTAKPSILAKIDASRITSDALSDASKGASIGDTVKDVIEAKGYLTNKSYAIMDEADIIEALQTLHDEGEKLVNNDISDSVGALRKGTLDTRVITSRLSSVGDDNNIFAVKVLRGSADSEFKDYKDYYDMAERGLVEASGDTAKNFEGLLKGGLFESFDRKLGLPGSRDEMFKDGRLSTFAHINIFDSFVYIDDLGTYHIDSSSEPVSDFRTFNVEHYLISSDIDNVKDSLNSWGDSPNNGFVNTSENLDNGDITIPEVSGEALIGIYITYAYAGLYNDLSSDAKKDTIGRLGYKLNNEALPEIPDKALILSQEAQSDQMLDAIKGWLYYLLHPTDGFSYFRIWITNKLNSFLLGWHDDMVGTNGTGSINGTTRYRGFSGYVTTPELTDLEWTSSLLNAYNSAIPFLLVIMLLLMLGSYIVGMLSLQKAIIGFLIFAVAVSLPPTVINSAVGTANRFASSLYGEKFTYWALIQHESYSDDIDAAAKGESYSNYLRTLYEKNAEAKGNQGTESVMLKWQAPKKMASLVLTESDRNAFDSLTASALIAPLINATYSGESYLDKEDAVYLYRSYIDIANFSRYIHRGLSGTNSVQPTDMNLTNDVTDSWDESLKNTIHDYATEYEKDRSLGYTNLNGDGSTSGTGSNILRVRLPLSSRLVTDALAQRGTIKDLGIDDYVGIDQRAFNFSIPLFNVEGLTYSSVLETNGYTMEHLDADYSGLAAYGLMSENPFYYFSWYLYETGLTEETSNSSGYKKLLLGSDNAGFFYNTKGNSEMKDFMDLKSLFTYVIPYLKQGNDLVHEWNDTYGIFVYEGVPTEENLQDTEILNNPELRQKYWHNLNVARLYNVYTPWVDIMYDCSYAKPEKISYLGDDYLITDPINPATYPEDRPMIFSKSEMLDYGMSIKDLTKVEKLILECEEGMQERLFKLLNYHTFNDVVLNTAAAMNCAFEFNETFSENTLFGVNNNIYPQAYELKDFSYDAFLRFILSNTTGDSMVTQGGESFYKGVVDRSSMTTVIVMLVLDVLAMYVIPGCKVFFIVGIFLLAFLLIVVTAFRVDKEQKFIMKLIKSFILPVLKFLGITCGMALIISWFMGEGNTSITGSMDVSISVGDPVIVMLLMIALNCFVVYLYFKILKGILNDIKSNGKMAVSFVGGVVASLGGAITSMVTGGKSGSKASSGGSGSSAGSGGGSSKGSGGLSNARAQERGIFAIGKGNREERIGSTSDRVDNDSRYDRKTGRKIANLDENKPKTEGKSKDIDEKAKRGLSKLFSNDKKESSNEEGSKKTKGEGSK